MFSGVDYGLIYETPKIFKERCTNQLGLEITETIQNKKRSVDSQFQSTRNRWKDLLSCKWVISYGKGRLSQQVKLRSQKAEPRNTESNRRGNCSQGAELGSNPELVSGAGNTCLAGFQITMDQELCVICLPLLPVFNGSSIMVILCLCHQDKEINGWV